MTQPKWYDYMFPVLKVLETREELDRNVLKEKVADYVGLTEELKRETLPKSPNVFRYKDRIGWALTYLKQSGLIISPKRSIFKITEDGVKLLKEKEELNQKVIFEEDLEKYSGYSDFIKRAKEKNTRKENKDNSKQEFSSETPDEHLATAEAETKKAVCMELLERVRNLSYTQFEVLVLDLFKKMGYGDKLTTKHTGGAGDGGIDGVVFLDKLGLDTIYLQAKKYKETNIVSPHDVRDFIGAVSTVGKGSKRGVLITTSDFTQEGINNAKEVRDPKIILINGEKLAELMYENNLGVSIKKTIEIKGIDSDYFEEE